MSTDTFKQSGITFIGTVINGALGALFYIIAARNLGPASFGLLSVAIALLTLTGDIGDLGTDTGLVRFVGKYIKSDPKKAKRFLKLGLKIKILVSFLILVIGLTFSPLIAKNLFSKPELTTPFKIISFGVGTYLLFTFITHTLQALQKFIYWSAVQVATNLVRVILLILSIYYLGSNLNNVLTIYILMPLMGFILALPLLPKGFMKVKKELRVIKDFFHYNKWVAVFTLVSAVGARLDTFISARLLSSHDLGIYSRGSAGGRLAF